MAMDRMRGAFKLSNSLNTEPKKLSDVEIFGISASARTAALLAVCSVLGITDLACSSSTYGTDDLGVGGRARAVSAGDAGMNVGYGSESSNTGGVKVNNGGTTVINGGAGTAGKQALAGASQNSGGVNNVAGAASNAGNLNVAGSNGGANGVAGNVNIAGAAQAGAAGTAGVDVGGSAGVAGAPAVDCNNVTVTITPDNTAQWQMAWTTTDANVGLDQTIPLNNVTPPSYTFFSTPGQRAKVQVAKTAMILHIINSSNTTDHAITAAIAAHTDDCRLHVFCLNSADATAYTNSTFQYYYNKFDTVNMVPKSNQTNPVFSPVANVPKNGEVSMNSSGDVSAVCLMFVTGL